MDFLARRERAAPHHRTAEDGRVHRSLHLRGKQGISDTHVLALADEAGLILITQDHDFGQLAILRRMPVTGVLLLELARLPLREQVERVAGFLSTDPAELVGKLTVIEPARVRVRALPQK